MESLVRGLVRTVWPADTLVQSTVENTQVFPLAHGLMPECKPKWLNHTRAHRENRSKAPGIFIKPRTVCFEGASPWENGNESVRKTTCRLHIYCSCAGTEMECHVSVCELSFSSALTHTHTHTHKRNSCRGLCWKALPRSHVIFPSSGSAAELNTHTHRERERESAGSSARCSWLISHTHTARERLPVWGRSAGGERTNED